MYSIWAFLLQTLTVSLLAALLLAVKWLLRDQLSPRWQYGIWAVLALAVLWPAGTGHWLLFPLPLWVEALKTLAESRLASAFAAPYTPVALDHVLPVVRALPRSLTDWLFLVYAAGVLVTLVWHLSAWLRLRRLVRKASPAGPALQQRLAAVCARYGLRSAPAVELPGLSSAFLCGVVRPVLVVPAGQCPDEKVLLHELLHLRHQDTLQNLGWCVLRALHWCNPFLQYVFDRVGNDMESLCDQRVLERLDGEARRDYGRILLEMANEPYARAPGTSSLSNGGRNIARRIGAIVRFRQYPRGMALVSVCIVLVLGAAVFTGTSAHAQDLFQPDTPAQQTMALAMTRLERCETAAGALDTYAKSLLWGNGIFRAMAAPLDQQPALTEALQQAAADEWVLWHLDPGPLLEGVQTDNTFSAQGYAVYNLQPAAQGGYEALLAFSVWRLPDESGEGLLQDEDGEILHDCSVLVPVRVWQEDGWVVEETGPRQPLAAAFDQLPYLDGGGLPPLARYTASGAHGHVTVEMCTQLLPVTAPGLIMTRTDRPIPDAVFAPANCYFMGAYTWAAADGAAPAQSFAVQLADTDDPYAPSVFGALTPLGNAAGSSTDGYNWASATLEQSPDGTVYCGGRLEQGTADGTAVLPAAWQARLYWDGAPVEDLTLQQEETP